MAVTQITVRGILIEIDNNLQDDDGTLYFATVDGDTVATGRTLEECVDNARVWAQ